MKKTPKTSDSKAPAANTRSTATTNSRGQTDLFARAMKCFSSADYGKAKALFDQASQGPSIGVTESATMYSRMCVQRLEGQKLQLKTGDDHYNYAISLMNLRRLNDAVTHLGKAIQMQDSSHARYAMALACGLQGDLPAAVAHLQKAIEIDPSTRTLARNDVDFLPLLQDPVIRNLIVGNRSGEA